MKWLGHILCTGVVGGEGEMRNSYNVLVRRPERKRPLRRPRYRQSNNIKMYLREIGFGDVD
jgi:hypothetical protein